MGFSGVLPPQLTNSAPALTANQQYTERFRPSSLAILFGTTHRWRRTAFSFPLAGRAAEGRASLDSQVLPLGKQARPRTVRELLVLVRKHCKIWTVGDGRLRFPIIHKSICSNKLRRILWLIGPVALPDCRSGGCGFESRPRRFSNPVVTISYGRVFSCAWIH